MSRDQSPNGDSHQNEVRAPLLELAGSRRDGVPDPAFDIDAFDASPWIGLHYRYESLLHYSHELLERIGEEAPPTGARLRR
jgi:hypothetical protein